MNKMQEMQQSIFVKQKISHHNMSHLSGHSFDRLGHRESCVVKDMFLMALKVIVRKERYCRIKVEVKSTAKKCQLQQAC